MRFIAVFHQLQTSSGLGFDNLVEAVDFLFWGYEDEELVPHGVYDTLTDQATPYDHAGQLLDPVNSESIRRIAKEYLTTIRPWGYFLRPSAS